MTGFNLYLPNDALVLNGLRDLHADLQRLCKTNAPVNQLREWRYWAECVQKASVVFAQVAQNRAVADFHNKESL